MSDFNIMVQRFTIRESDKIKKICAPLHEQFGVNHFWYSETTSEGGYFSLASNPAMHDYYHSSKLHLHSPFFHNPELIEPGFYFYNMIKDKKFQESFDACSNRLKLAFGGSLVVKKGKSMLRFGYAFEQSVGKQSTAIIVNNFHVLEKFNHYFVQEAKELIKQARLDLVNLPDELGAAYEQPTACLGQMVSHSEKCAFLERLGLLKAADVKRLSKRELEVLEQIHHGQSARLIANKLHISKRTAEQHIDSIKNKLGCFSKAELCHYADLLHTAGFFP